MAEITESTAMAQLKEQSLCLQDASERQTHDEAAESIIAFQSLINVAAHPPVAEIENNAHELLILKKLHDCVSSLQLIHGKSETERLITFMVDKMKISSACLSLAVKDKDKRSVEIFANILLDPCQAFGLDHLSELIRRVSFELEHEDWHNINTWTQILLKAIQDSSKTIEKVSPKTELSEQL